ncbi:MAG: carboxylesterase family protein [Bacteroidetes bacterium]|nr:carboxylesterase family protein [Bacteroidota bacterium]
MKKLVLLIWLSVHLIAGCTSQQDDSNLEKQYTFVENISYKSDYFQDEYEEERCKLDLYLPNEKKNFPVMVWFHGGSLKRGSKDDKMTRSVGMKFANEGIAVAVVNYRLSPKAKYPAYINDAAAAVAWVFKNISGYGGNPNSVFIAGHSAGGYQVYMLALNPEFLKKYDVESINIAGVIPVAGQTFTHYTVREERGIEKSEKTPVIDDASPCFLANKNTPPMLIIWADGDTYARIEENKSLINLLNKEGNNNIYSKEILERTHWSLIRKIPKKDDPLAKEIIDFISKYHQLK